MGLLGTDGFINWESESYPVASDFTFVPFFALFFLSVRLFLDKYIFESLAKRLIFGNSYASVDVGKRANRKKINKFKESAWKYVYFLSAELFALYVSYREPWFTNTKYFWVGPADQIWPDQKLKFARVGSIILALHDASDGFMEIAKISRYSGYEWISSIFFLGFVLSWTILRIIYFPFWVLWSTSYEVLLTLDMEKHMVDGPLYYYLFNTLLFSLVVFNVYWWSLMVGMVVEQIKARGRVSKDVRSDSEGEEEHDD
ncbi:hypothetical protein P3X46_002809 [Hevea brasiliensis]|uniref:TLC domain-containing protein n=1 Tax=Hevea brasiliensis TaxID=3981 RepID=A0ABQ9N7Z7_HEVBR|nr:ceramide synthase 1 LOH3 isoform X2 [Hevea brasiliensis]KAJ9187345.1 hypothetical protein P3X46_002809 [Hevea brasiliensis]